MEAEPEVQQPEVKAETPVEKTKRARPKKQPTKKVIEVTDVLLKAPPKEEPKVEPKVEPEVTPAAEEAPAPETPVELKTPRARKTTKKAESTAKRTRKVSVAVEELQQAAEEEQNEEEASEVHAMSTSDLIALQRLTSRQIKSQKYKQLLQGHV